MTISAIQGHPYLFGNHKVIALDYGTAPKVLFIRPDQPSSWQVQHVLATELTPLPLRYFHGQLPK